MSDPKVQVNRYELAWAAGFFDGEGCTTWNGPTKVVLKVGQSGEECPEVLQRFVKAFPPGLLYISLEKSPTRALKHPNYLPAWTARTARFENVQQAICMMWPYLGTVKREQATAALLNTRNARTPKKFPITHCRRAGHEIAVVGRDRSGYCRACKYDRKMRKP